MPEKIILHWLNFSRSHRILWLLEELNVDYELKLYQRTKEFRAPKELNKVHPLGKSPVIEIVAADGTSKVIAESGHITNYLIRKYDTEGRLVPSSDDDKEKAEWFLHYVEGTLQPLLVSLLVGETAKQMAPFGTKFLVNKVVKAMNDGFYLSELLKNLDYLESIAKAQHAKGSEYLVGDKLNGADILASFPIQQNVFSNPERAQSIFGRSDVYKKYPHLHQWAQFIAKEPKYVKANQIIEKLEGKSKL
ncbi:thioredoxin-like protein [Suhomyces tanzawaensis NRRL Y-17324]|uniref:glutathione transferase n=1 Tax=Suhomyces tanzawaensis NRRL Y-17324 TaxID=984487 RepID=A0A1E4SIA1_9ASCO|nr:thioredoxin-like protein [Suhomyces tanzawaensis NRRL Y-17324]ODV79249.1 thioredoxin-like protein [Suhomyces tanzawaensis NRRL Y-17324]